MPEKNEHQTTTPPPAPDPEKLKPAGLSNAHKRYLYYGVTLALVVLILANIVGSRQGTPSRPTRPSLPGQEQNPTAAQIQDWENNLKQAEAQLEQEGKNRHRQLEAARAAQQAAARSATEDLQRAQAEHDAAEARQRYRQAYGKGAGPYGQAQPKSQIETEQEQQAYKSLFADNVVRQESTRNSSTPPLSEAHPPAPATPPATAVPKHETKPAESKNRNPLDFDPSVQPTAWLPEGTVLEAVLTNRLDGNAVGPVDCMLTSNVYQPGTRMLLIPQGARVLGEASAVSSLGQQRLAVAFHRIVVPGLRTYSIPLTKAVPALGQTGDVGLQDKVENHYVSIFGSSLAIGAIGGLAQIGNGYSGFGYDPSVEMRNGITQSMAQSSSRILDRFLNRMPTIAIREGTRVKILLTGDLQLPIYDSIRQGVF
jgi:type IV secretory pathway VirB10-like protein